MSDKLLAFVIAFFGVASLTFYSPQIAGVPALVLVGVVWWLVFQFLKRANSNGKGN